MGHARTDTTSSPPHYFDDAHQQDAPDTLDFDLDSIIPETHEHRTLVLCFDGTGDQFDDDNSNVVNFFSMLKKDSPQQQLVYYQAGIGTYTIPQIAKPMAAKFKKVLDMMVGVHLDAHVMGGYEFLMQNYESGDKICIFGFSRGAYTARALAGMIHKIGLLPRCNHQQVPFAYKMYSREDEKGWQQSGTFKQSFSIDVDIEFLGVWDTVGSVGVIPKRLPFTTSNTHVRYFRHAVSLDERRARFKPNLWQRQPKNQKQLGLPPGAMPRVWRRPTRKSLRDLERQYSGDGECATDVEEVWFAGCHTDVGGGAVPNNTRHSLARIPLRWMIRQCFLLKTGIMFHREMLKIVGMDPSTLYPDVIPRPPALTGTVAPTPSNHGRQPTGSSVTTEDTRIGHFTGDFVNEEEEEFKDALSPVYDMLKKKWGWWILEVIPQTLKYQNDDDYSWVQEMTWGNWGKPRHIPHKHGVKVHRSVKIRMDAEAEALKLKEKYVPKPKWNFDPIWVD
ncbi:hypothetical protein E1B28_001947 [Marasmius oreades]|uniref:T6SS Phospholipase effector Tle1-like catalytic domain-containing protein n=1 Tax=Marasmius oreades TaxID=181124 RepID=A0A9P8AFY4_9AGAR|nr:uncharacterized protein E1B28_001947 [Marasmius oreades]KAG7100167.1 hypothetical protein E1B28_001947 [Marasmius oreades]